MALRAVPDHPKFAHLKSLLKQPRGAVLGWLEGTWHFAGRFTPQGNIGKYSDLAIESWLEWDGEEGKLIEALVKSGWLDVDENHRLIVHDWEQHADRATRAQLKRSRQEFCVPGVVTPCTHREHTVSTPEPMLVTASSLPGAVPVPEPVPEPEGDALPPDMPMLNYARWALESCNLPVTFPNQQAVAAAIGAFSRERKLLNHHAAEGLAKLARDALAAGVRVDKFWFEDAKWRGGARNGNGANRAQERTDGNKRAAQGALDDLLAGNAGPG